MAKLINEETNEEVEVKDNDQNDLVEKAEELGIPFGCQDGICGACRVEVVEGMENLSEFTEQEKDLGFDESGNERLLCQCKIKKGIVKIRF
jgi:ferredoxin